MTESEIKALVIKALNEIAPEADTTNIEPDVTFHDQFDIDSMDFINLVTMLGKELQLEIPEEDCYQLATLNGCIAYLMQKTTATA